MKKNYLKISRRALKVIALLLINSYVFAQIPITAATADPAAVSITLVPVGTTINSSAVVQFKYRNDATLVNVTGQNPIGSVRVTITFPATSAFTSVNSIPKFEIEGGSSNQPNGTITLVNTILIDEQEEINLLLNVRGTATGNGTITFGVSVTIPQTTANLETSNDNTSASFNTLTVLPVQIKSFTATSNSCINKINWQSTTEINLKNYSLEYSNDGATYSNVYDVNAKGDNSSYSTNYNATEGKNYYRLKMLDFDGAYVYSQIILLNNNCNKSRAIVYPNPASELLNINITSNNSQITKATLYDAGGKAMLQQNFKVGLNSMKINALAKGSYTLHLNAAGLVETIQVLIK